MNIDSLDQQLARIRLQGNPNNQLVTMLELPDEFQLVGMGTDAAVVRHSSDPTRVFKVYTETRVAKIDIEYQVYRQLAKSPFFAKAYFRGSNYLCLSYEPGPTLYECLEQGIVIPFQVVIDVEQARISARNEGLNPRDIHLKNVLLQEGRAKLIDVSEYVLPGDDHRWDHIVQGYHDYYELVKGKKIPTWMIEWVKKAYYHQLNEDFSITDFLKRVQQMITLK